MRTHTNTSTGTTYEFDPSTVADEIRAENLARFDGTIAKALASPGTKPGDAEFLAAVRAWVSTQTEAIAPAIAIRTYIAANPGSSPR